MLRFRHFFFITAHTLHSGTTTISTNVSYLIDLKLNFRGKNCYSKFLFFCYTSRHHQLFKFENETTASKKWCRKYDTTLVYVFARNNVCIANFCPKDNTIIADWIIFIVNFCYCASSIKGCADYTFINWEWTQCCRYYQEFFI